MRRWVLLVLALGLIPLSVTPVQASGVATASGTWSLEPQSRDRGGDRFIDGDGGVPSSGALSADPSKDYVGAGNGVAQPNERLIDGSLSWYLPAEGLTVRLNACTSKGNTYTWLIRSGGELVTRTAERPLTKKKCRTRVSLAPGQYTFTLVVRGSGRTARVTLPANVRNRVIVSLGDSYASGEGNPRNVDAWLGLRSPLGSFRAYYDDERCRRSAQAAPAQAALRLEQADRRSTVTFVHLACSGASIQRGILAPQSSGIPAQIDALAALAKATPIDAIVISVGGNDIGFGTILETCLLNNDCPLARANSGPLSRYPNIQEGAQQLLGQLERDFRTLNQRIRAITPNTPIYITMYPDITRNAAGGPCSYLGMPQRDFAWARDTLLVPNPAANYPYRTAAGTTVPLPLPNGSLNAQVARTQALGWQPIIESWAASGESARGHGICALDESWVIGVNFNGNTSGSFHPNPRGQIAIANAIVNAMSSAG